GALALGMHARRLAPGAEGAPVTPALAALQPFLGGMRIEIPAAGGVTLAQHGGAALLTASGVRAEPAVRIDLCTQVLDPARARLLPLRIGFPLDGAAALARAGGGPVRNVLLGANLPRVTVTGDAPSGLKISWQAGAAAAWIGDATQGAIRRGNRGEAALGHGGWLVWQGEALRFSQRASRACPQAGELLVQRYRPDAAAGGAALLQAFPVAGEPVALRLAPGSYQVPAAPPPGMEDQALFDQLRARGLLRLSRDGLAELAPRDLAAWQAADPDARAPLPGWEGLNLDEGDRSLLARLYQRADGAYVREQVRIFNSERRLVAWRVRPGSRLAWQARLADAPAPGAEGLPVAAMRLFARLQEDWAPWTRVAGWDGGRGGNLVTLSAPALRAPAELLLAGRLLRAEGARATVTGACDGRACQDRDMVQHVLLTPEPGAGSVRLEVAPLDLSRLSGDADAAYRHLRVEEGRLAWHALPGQATVRTGGATPVRLSDRHGALLWADGRPAADAGLAPLLGVHRQHAGSVAGMLARLGGAGHEARLSLDLGVQAQAQAALDCIGMRQGQWDGKTCLGGQAPPAERQAGLVLLDAERGDILAAASSGSGKADPARWAELRDFDRADPARSPLRIAAFQHDGGAHRAPGSTFKVITALGLEQAAKEDPRLEGLLSGIPVEELDRMARERGYGFRAASATYPASGQGAHVTNFREQSGSARAHGGRLGLDQALSYSINTWFAWLAELSDRSLLGRPEGGVPGVRALDAEALDTIRPVAGMARRLGFGSAPRLDGGLLPEDYRWAEWDALRPSASALDPVQTRHELRQMAIGLRMQATPLQMALTAAAVGEGRTVTPRLLLQLDGRAARDSAGEALDVPLERIRAGMKGVIDRGTAAGAFRGAAFERLRPGLYGKTGTAPAGRDGQATVWFMGWLEPGSLPGQTRRLAFAAFVSHSDATGGGHAAPVVAALLRAMEGQSREQKEK
ncbi:penicillin-binding transpeptidase domain-containing protein, partial [Massilia sp. ZL223]|uniref:penicillin-binding transpeptidase domain-containing protein n=1 Tax=Massilia sp. ZL223 TaxID=2824904 RepID=UPI001B828C98